MKNRGFTLIELLAVIVILAIISLIATPIIINIVDSSKDNTLMRNVEFYMDAVEYSMVNRLNLGEIENGTYSIIEETGNICLEEYEKTTKTCNDSNNDNVIDMLNVKITGEKPTGGTITIENNRVVDVNLIYFGKSIVKNSDGQFIHGYKVGTPIYFNVETGTGCTELDYKESWDATTQDYLNSKTGYNGFLNIIDRVENAGGRIQNQNACLKFYSLIDDGSEIVSLILDHNTKSYYGWRNWGTTENHPQGLINGLREQTSSWKGTITPKNYIFKENYFTMDYSRHKARIITPQEIANIVGIINWDFNEIDLNIKENNSTISKYYWLYDRTYGCENKGCNKSDNLSGGYWTILPFLDGNENVLGAFGVSSGGLIKKEFVDENSVSSHGIRPVIDVYKSNLVVE